MGRFFMWRKSMRRFGKEKSGAAAVEFGLIAVPFFLMLIGSLEVAMLGFAQTSLDFAVAEAGREIRTGRVQQGGVSAAEVRQELCTQVNRFMVLNCDGSLYLDVERYPSFVAAAAGTENPIDEDGVFQSDGFGFTPGADSDIVVVRAYYQWEVITPMFERLFANTAAGQRVLVSTMMFRNEPFGPIVPAGP